MEIMDCSIVMTPEDQLKEAMTVAGITPPAEIIMDGSIRRFSTHPGDPRDTAGWYVAFGDGVPAGSFGDWRTGEKRDWYATLPRDLTIEERKQQEERVTQARREREAYLNERMLQAHRECTDIFDEADPAPEDHPYLVKKGIKPHTAKISKHGDLILPLKLVTGDIVSLQYIKGDGTKRFHKGSSTKEGMEIIGRFTKAKRIFICEGYATGATIHEHTGMPVIIAYSAGNLDTVARIMKVEVPDAEFMIVADNDESGVGQAKATEAGVRNNMQVIIPPVVGDVNDYAQAGGNISALLMPKKRYSTLAEFCLAPAPIDWLIRNWVQAVGLSMVHGASGSGKTFVVLDWLLHIATGQPEWKGHKVKQGGVVYLAGEGHNGLKGRMAAWLQHYQVDPVGVPMIVTHGATDLDDRNCRVQH
jgi:phage/plasmid primase-like uncharacterized protein